MKVDEFITNLRKDNDIVIAVSGNELKIMAPQEALTAEVILQIKNRKSEILEFYNGIDLDKEFSAIPSAGAMPCYPLSSVQKRLYFLYQYDKNSIAYNVTQIVKLNGVLDSARVETVFKKLIARHESLRTTFTLEKDGPVQRVLDSANFSLTKANLNSEDLPCYIKGFCGPFNLAEAPLFRAALVEIQPMEHVLIVDMHHIITDGVSQGILIKDFIDLYNDKDLRELTLQYKDYAVWQESGAQSRSLQLQEKFWMDEYREKAVRLELPVDHERPEQKSYHGSSVEFTLGEDETNKLAYLAEASGTTLFMVVLSLFNVLLSKLSNQDDIVVGVPSAGRQHADLENIIGMFVNTLPIRNYPTGNQSFIEFLRSVKAKTLACFNNQAYQYEQLIENLELNRDPARNPLFDVMMAYQKSEHNELQLTNLKIEPYKNEQNIAKFDLTFFITEGDNYIHFDLGYATDLFKKSTVTRILNYFKNILEAVINNPNLPLSNINMLSQSEYDQIINEFNPTTIPYPSEETLVSLLEKQVRKTPDNVAIISRNNKLTYRELWNRSRSFSCYLREEKGINTGDLIGVLLDRELELIPVIYGILAAGCVYVPIDPHFPEARIDAIVVNAGLKTIVTRTRHIYASLVLPIPPVDLENDLPVIYNYRTDVGFSAPTGSDLCYVIHTSGSTGAPKGVMIQHHSVINRLIWMQKKYPLTEADVILQKTPIIFDVSIWELFWWSFAGASVSMLPPGGEKDPAVLISTIQKDRITTLHFVPSMLETFLAYLDSGVNLKLLKSVSRVFSSGEVLKPHHVKLFGSTLYKANHTGLTNLYGPTETTVDVSCYECDFENTAKKIPIGAPIDNIHLLVFDKYGQLCPIGVPGELFIGGAGVGAGYINNKAMTQERFVKDPMRESGLLYNSGDLAKWLEDGNLDYIGRIDQQVKIRGVRIELGEIENQLKFSDLVQSAAVLMKEKGDDKSLLAFYVPTPKDGFTLRKILAQGDKATPFVSLSEFPNGLSLYTYNNKEIDFLYDEIFIDNTYLQNGMSIPQDGVIFDVGANLGMFSVYAHLTSRSVKVFSFEPIPPIFDLLQLNTSLYDGNFAVFNFGLSDKAETAVFNYYPNATILSTNAENADAVKETVKQFIKNELKDNKDFDEININTLLEDRLVTEQYNCQLKTISQVIAEQDVQRIDLLKIDVENAEFQVLRGIEEADWAKIEQIVIEVHDTHNRLIEIESLLLEKGYQVVIGQNSGLIDTNVYDVYAHKQGARQVPVVKYEEINTANVLGPKKYNNLLRKHLSDRLPEFMIPSFFIPVPELPLTSSGKLDRKALLAIDIDLKDRYVAAKNETQHRLVHIFSEVLKIEADRISIDSSFFELGGHSLRAVILINKISKELNVEVSLKDVFKYETVNSLSKIIDGSVKGAHRSIPLSSKTGGYVLSSAQRRLYFLYEYDNSSTAYNIPQSILLEGKLDRARLEDSFRRLISRHESLRTSFGWQGEEPVQRISETVDFAIEEIRDTGEEGLRSFCRPFDLGKAPLLRVGLQTLGAEEHVLMVDMHHIITDGVSQGILIEDFMRFYRGEEPVPLALQYKDYAEWQQSEEERSALAVQQGYWEEEYAEGPPVLELPTDHARPHQKSYEGSSAGFRVDSSTTRRLKAIGEEQGATMFMVILSVYTILLSKISNQEDIVVGVPTAGRDHADLEGVIGMFVNTLAIRNHVEGGQSYRNYLSAVKAKTLSGFRNQSYQYEQLIDLLKIERDPGRNPLFDVMLAYQNFEQKEIRLGDLKITPYNREKRIAQFDITLAVSETGDTGENLMLTLEYYEKLFTKETVERFISYFKRIFSIITSDPDIKISDIEILSPENKNRLLIEFNDSTVNYPKDKTVVDLFEQQALKTPDKTAIYCDGKELTYHELNSRSNKLANYLKRRFSIKPDDLIGVMMDRSENLLVAIYAILKTGAAYVPIDPAYPQSRIRLMIENSNLIAILTEFNSDELSMIVPVVSLPQLAPDIALEPDGNPEKIVNAASLMYVIYTSGSTGVPKGVMVRHHSFTNLVNWYVGLLELSAKDSVLLVAPISFDLAQKNLFAPLMIGASLCLSESFHLNYQAMANAIDKYDINVINLAPSAFYPLLEKDINSNFLKLRSLKKVVLGGEPINTTKILEWHRSDYYNALIINSYGPTECTDVVSFYKLEDKDITDTKNIPIGKPIDNTQLYILDSRNKYLPIGVAGEIFVGGEGVSNGYLNNQPLTSQKFIKDPFKQSGNLYRTGDVGKWLPDGNIAFLGRKDDQVKIRGFRIELGEIESQLMLYDQITEAVVIAKDIDNAKSLVAYYVCPEEISTAKLRSFLLEKLPEYMVPGYFCNLKGLPLTPSGKLDKRALPEPIIKSEGGFRALNEVQDKLVKIWAEVLKLEEDVIDLDKSFFDLGGHSLKAVSMISKIEKEMNMKIQLDSFFMNPTIKEIEKDILIAGVAKGAENSLNKLSI